MKKEKIEQLYLLYKKYLLNIAMPFWSQHCVDKDCENSIACDMVSESYRVISLAEYAKETKDKEGLKKGKEIYYKIVDLYKNLEDPHPKANYRIKQVQSVELPIAMLIAAQALREIDRDPIYNEFTMELVHTLANKFYKPSKRDTLKMLNTSDMLCVNVGYAMKTSWLIMQEALLRNDTLMMRKALDILDNSFEIGWDKQYGKIKYSIASGSDVKLLCTHVEAIYALLLADYITGYAKYGEWHQKIHQLVFNHFSDKINEEWIEYLRIKHNHQESH